MLLASDTPGSAQATQPCVLDFQAVRGLLAMNLTQIHKTYAMDAKKGYLCIPEFQPVLCVIDSFYLNSPNLSESSGPIFCRE